MARRKRSNAESRRHEAEQLLASAAFGGREGIRNQITNFVLRYDLLSVTGNHENVTTAVKEIPKVLDKIDLLEQSPDIQQHAGSWRPIKEQIDNLFGQSFDGEAGGRGRKTFRRLPNSVPQQSATTSTDDTRRLQRLTVWLIANRIVEHCSEDLKFASSGQHDVLLEVMERVDESTSLEESVDPEDRKRVETATHALLQVPKEQYRLIFEPLGLEYCQAVLSGVLDVPYVKTSIDEVNAGLGTAVRQMVVEGCESLTRDELRKLQTFAANRLKDAELDQQVKLRAIAEDIFPLAKLLFPGRVGSPEDVDAESLTALFRENADDPKTNAAPLSSDQLKAIKDLSQAWRRHFQHVVYRGDGVNVSLAGADGLFFRKPGRGGESRGTSKFWPKLEFRPRHT